MALAVRLVRSVPQGLNMEFVFVFNYATLDGSFFKRLKAKDFEEGRKKAAHWINQKHPDEGALISFVKDPFSNLPSSPAEALAFAMIRHPGEEVVLIWEGAKEIKAKALDLLRGIGLYDRATILSATGQNEINGVIKPVSNAEPLEPAPWVTKTTKLERYRRLCSSYYLPEIQRDEAVLEVNFSTKGA